MFSKVKLLIIVTLLILFLGVSIANAQDNEEENQDTGCITGMSSLGYSFLMGIGLPLYCGSGIYYTFSQGNSIGIEMDVFSALNFSFHIAYIHELTNIKSSSNFPKLSLGLIGTLGYDVVGVFPFFYLSGFGFKLGIHIAIAKSILTKAGLRIAFKLSYAKGYAEFFSREEEVLYISIPISLFLQFETRYGND